MIKKLIMTVNASNSSTSTGGATGAPVSVSQSQSTSQQQHQGPTGGLGTQPQGQPGTATGGNPTSAAARVQHQVQLPPPTVTLTMELHNNIPLNKQRCYATQLYTFLTQANADLSILNNPANNQTTCMVNIPDTSKVRIVHSLGFGTNPIGHQGSITNC